MTAVMRTCCTARTVGARAALRVLARLDAHPEPLPSDAEIAEEIAAARREHVALDAVKPRPLGFQGPC